MGFNNYSMGKMMKLVFVLMFVKLASAQVYFPFNPLYAGQECYLDGGIRGTCKNVNLCQSVVQKFVAFRARPVICSFEGFTPIVCCPVGESQPQVPNRIDVQPTPGPTRPPQILERISQRKCREYSNCKSVFKTAIVGGEDADVGEFPHMIAVGWPLAGNSGYAWNCGGSLISEYFVMTAAHCTFLRDTSLANDKPTVVRVGEHNLRDNNDGAYPQDIQISNIILHPQYKPPSKYNDIALLQLASPANFNQRVKPACLWQSNNFPVGGALATGWGKIGHLSASSDVLQKVFLPIVDNDSCQRAYRPNRNIMNGIIKEQLCAGDVNGGKDTCQGDSGGPLSILDSQNHCSYHVIGVTSFGIGCGGINTPAVYTRISSYIDWIESVVWRQ